MVPRPVSLKNKSIQIIREFSSEVVMGREFFETAKGTVAHMKPPLSSIERSGEPALPAWVIFPKFQAGASTNLSRRSKARTLIKLTKNAFNHSALGQAGFETAAGIIERCDCFDFIYSNLEEAVTAFNGLEPSKG
jgi:HprK-related kinase A